MEETNHHGGGPSSPSLASPANPRGPRDHRQVGRGGLVEKERQVLSLVANLLSEALPVGVGSGPLGHLGLELC